MATEVKRADRVAPRMRRELAELIGATIKDPRAREVIITRVDVTGDLAFARVYFRLLTGAEDRGRAEQATRGLESASGMLRREVGRRMQLQKTPELRFVYDDGQDARARVEQLLEEIRVEDDARDPKE